jgi:excisionase family DNA binding protein
MSSGKKKLTDDEIRAAFATGAGPPIPPILSPAQLADLIGISVKTVYAWIAAGRLDGCFRKRGKHVLIWRDRAVAELFDGATWSNE